MQTTSGKLEASELFLSKVLGDDYVFEIPSYQRPYAWEREQVVQLIEDIDAAIAHRSDEPYFLGSLVIVRRPDGRSADVIDGQQRLTTLTILLAVIRDLTPVDTGEHGLAGFIYRPEQEWTGQAAQHRLLPRDRADDRQVFEDYVQRIGATSKEANEKMFEGSGERFVANTRIIRDLLRDRDPDELRALGRFLLSHCMVVMVTVPNVDAAMRIFTVLNARGLNLTATDILKAQLLQKESGSEELAERWENWERDLGRDRFGQLFAHIRMTRERENPRSGLDVGFGRAVPELDRSAKLFMDRILDPFASAYELLLNPDDMAETYGVEAGTLVRSLLLLDNGDWVPPALAFLVAQGKEVDREEMVTTFLFRLERLAYAMFVSRESRTHRIRRYVPCLRALSEGDADEASELLELDEGEREGFRVALDAPVYTVPRIVKPLLIKLDHLLSSGGLRHEGAVSVEHVLPQTPRQEWLELIPDAEQRAYWTHRLANLVLLTHRKNTSASNRSFEEKKRTYFVGRGGRSPFPITQEVLDMERWDLATLQQRQSRLVETLSRAWNL